MRDRSLSPALFAIFAQLIEETCGVEYGPGDTILAAKLEAHAMDLGHESLLNYYYRLRYDDPEGTERRKLIEAIVVHETYFFRELAPLEQLVEGHLNDIIKSKGRARVWSAACSTGEEPFTLAMVLAERGLLGDVEIVASDVSAAALARAHAGEHGRRSVRENPPEAMVRHYLKQGPNGVTVVPRIRQAVRFELVNLLDEAAIMALGPFDAIVCRNVLIYFRDEQAMRVVERMTRALAPGGVIAVGISESLLRFGSTLKCEERGGSYFYRSVR